MADQKISELTALTGANLADVDAFAVVDTSAVQTKKITYAELKTALDTGTGFVRITGDTMTGNLIVPQVEIGNGSAGGTSELLFSDNVSARGKIKYNHGSNPEVLTIETTGTTALTIDNAQKATFAGAVTINNDLVVDTATNAKLTINDNVGEVGSGNLALQTSNSGGTALKPMGFRAEDIRFATGSDERVRITDTGLGIGAAPSYVLDVSGDKDDWISRIYNTGSDANAYGLLVRSDATAAHDAIALGVYADGGYKMVVRSTGKVAIGHTSSNALLQVSSGSGVAAGSQANPALQIGATTGYRLGMYTDAEGGYIENKNGDDGIIFKVKTAGEAMRIDGGTGNLGIGDSDPQEKFTIKGDGARMTISSADMEVAMLGRAGSSGSALDQGYLRLRNQGVTADGVVLSAAGDSWINGGNVGIGDSSPARALSTKSSTAATIASFESTSSVAGLVSFSDSNTTNDVTVRVGAVADNLVFQAGGSEQARIASAGEIQIGGTSNAGFVDFDGTALQLNTQRNPNTGTFVNTSKSHAGIALVGGDADSHIKFYTKDSNNAAGTERVRIDKEGNLLVGKTSSSFSTVGQEFRTAGVTIFGRDGGEPLTLNRITSDGGILSLRKDNTVVGSIGVANGDLNINGDTGIRFQDTSIMPRRAGADVDATVDLGLSSHRWKDLYLSGGAYLGGTGSANKLDDYEEGTWTPSATQGLTGFTIETATYTKVGRVVTLAAYLSSMAGKDANQLQIGGLPFTPASLNYSTGVVESGVDGEMGIVRTNAANGYLVFYKPDSSNERVNYAGNDSGTGHIIFSITYQVT